MDARGLPEKHKAYLPLFNSVLGQLSTSKRSYHDLSQAMEMTTGGIAFNEHVIPHHTEGKLFNEYVLLSSHCLDRNLVWIVFEW